ncbi:hypothetical protein BKA80DRAFT_263413 [Phyllosticta citrichinensis]
MHARTPARSSDARRSAVQHTCISSHVIAARRARPCPPLCSRARRLPAHHLISQTTSSPIWPTGRRLAC